MHYFPRADIHELLSPDLLHQLIKGTFKDHIVAWVEAYLEIEHGEAEAKKIMDDIDRRYISFVIALSQEETKQNLSRIAAAPSFPGLRRFSEGRKFKQWTGNDSKALMKVWYGLPLRTCFIVSDHCYRFSSPPSRVMCPMT